MLNVTTLLGRAGAADDLRYGRAGGRDGARTARERRPVVVWNCTRRCNLACAHCYSDSDSRVHPELSTEEGLALLEDLAEFRVPALLFSGGEPLIRPDVFTLIARARELSLPVTLSSNGTLITPERAKRLAELGVRYVGVSLDGIGAVHDAHRGRRGAFDRTIRGIRALRAEGVTTGVRITLTPAAIEALPDLIALIEREDIGRACFYHLVPAGRGTAQPTVDPRIVRGALDTIFSTARRWIAEGRAIEVLTVDNPADGPALAMWAAEHAPERVAAITEALSWNGGAANGAGRALASIDWEGRVRPDQFWPGDPLDTVRNRPLSRIWSEPPESLSRIRRRSERVGGRCTDCRWRTMCGGGLASRALAVTGRLESPDPACHLSDTEIAAPVPA